MIIQHFQYFKREETKTQSVLLRGFIGDQFSVILVPIDSKTIERNANGMLKELITKCLQDG